MRTIAVYPDAFIHVEVHSRNVINVKYTSSGQSLGLQTTYEWEYIYF